LFRHDSTSERRAPNDTFEVLFVDDERLAVKREIIAA
jgi:hypothetical protein